MNPALISTRIHLASLTIYDFMYISNILWNNLNLSLFHHYPNRKSYIHFAFPSLCQSFHLCSSRQRIFAIETPCSFPTSSIHQTFECLFFTYVLQSHCVYLLYCSTSAGSDGIMNYVHSINIILNEMSIEQHWGNWVFKKGRGAHRRLLLRLKSTE